MGLARDGSSYVTRHSFAQIGERNPTVEDFSHPAWQWDEQAVQSINQRMEGLAINALLVQLYQPELLSTGPAAKVRSGKDFAGAGDPEAWRARRARCGSARIFVWNAAPALLEIQRHGEPAGPGVDRQGFSSGTQPQHCSAGLPWHQR